MIKTDDVLKAPGHYVEFASELADELYREINPQLELLEDD